MCGGKDLIDMGEKTKTKARSSKKKAVKIWILFIVLALICGTVLFCLSSIKRMKMLYKETKSASASFEKTSQKVIDVISASEEEFINASPDERKKIAEKIMDDLIAQGVLKGKNISFDSENDVYQFVTNDGALNFIVLNDYDPNCMGMSDTQSNSDGSSGESGGTDGKNRGDEEYQYFHDGYPYSDEDLMAEDLDMLFFPEIHVKPENSDSDQNGYNYHKFFEDHAFQLCNQAHVKYKDIPQTTVEELKTCLKGYDYVSLDFHGFYYSNLAKVATLIGTASFKNVFTNLEQFYGLCRLESYLKGLYNEVDTTFLVVPENVGIGADICYKGDLVNGRLARHLANFGYNYLITPIFFYDYYDENDLNGTIVHLGACEGFKNETLPATFKACGAEAVVGYDESVHTDYSAYMEWRILHWLLYGGTIGESASFAKRFQGDKDPVKPHARLKIYGDKDAVLIKNAVCHKDYVLIDKSMSYEEAVKYCNDIGGRIAVVENPAEQRALNTLLKTAEKNCYWIGLKKGDGGTFYWETIGREQKYHFHWAMDEPSGDGTGIMVYGHPDKEKRTEVGEWNDINYNPNVTEGFYAADQFGIVCELSKIEAMADGIDERNDGKPDNDGNTVNNGRTEQNETSEKHKVIKFGKYKGNDINWLVLEEDDEKMLLLSREALEKKKYHDELVNVTWEYSSLRRWLNLDFYDETFDSDEKKRIIKTLNENLGNPEFKVEDGNATEDYVFLLSLEEVNKYLITDDARKAKYINRMNQEDYYCYWWLRSRGYDGGAAVFVFDSGSISVSGYGMTEDGFFVRPAIWVSKKSAEEVDYSGALSSDNFLNKDNTEYINEYQVITFGNYAGENIEWFILDENENGMLVISKDCIEAKKYNDENVEITWEDCTLRKWLNDSFYQNAFSSDEKKRIRKTWINNSGNAQFKVEDQNDTEDYVFLLSADEANKYFTTDYDRRAKATGHAADNGLIYYFADKVHCSWWLRSSRGSNSAEEVTFSGGIGSFVVGGEYSIFGVRPALWIDLER